MKTKRVINPAVRFLTALAAACMLTAAALTADVSAYAVYDFPTDIPFTDKTGSGSDYDTKEDAILPDTAKTDSRDNDPDITRTANPTIKQFLTKLETSTTIPTICVYTQDNAEVVSRNTYVPCTVYTINCDDEYRIDGAAAGIRVRGNSTAYEGNVELIRKNQVPYRIKFNKKQRMFGLNSDAACKSWVLLKAEYDLLKNDIAFRMGRSILRNGNYCSDGIPVHVYLNGSFAGIYELCEQNQINPNRISVYEAPDSYTGTDIGYLVELDNRAESPFFKMTYYGNATVTDRAGVTGSFKTGYCTLKNDNCSDKQLNFISKYINNCFKIIYRACEQGKYYVFDEDYNLKKAKKSQLKKTDDEGNAMDPAEIVADLAVDLDSFVDVFLVYEMTMSRDVGEGSFYMCADFSDPANIKKLTFTSPWDFEWSMMGATTGSYACEFNSPDFVKTYGERSNPWFVVLMKQEWFVNRVKDRWTELRTAKNKKKTNTIDKVIKEERSLLAQYKQDLSKTGTGAYYDAEGLIKWVEKRVKWMDEHYLND